MRSLVQGFSRYKIRKIRRQNETTWSIQVVLHWPIKTLLIGFFIAKQLKQQIERTFELVAR